MRSQVGESRTVICLNLIDRIAKGAQVASHHYVIEVCMILSQSNSGLKRIQHLELDGEHKKVKDYLVGQINQVVTDAIISIRNLRIIGDAGIIILK